MTVDRLVRRVLRGGIADGAEVVVDVNLQEFYVPVLADRADWIGDSAPLKPSIPCAVYRLRSDGSFHYSGRGDR